MFGVCLIAGSPSKAQTNTPSMWPSLRPTVQPNFEPSSKPLSYTQLFLKSELFLEIVENFKNSSLIFCLFPT